MKRREWLLIAFVGAIVVVSFVYIIGRITRPGGWQDQVWTTTSDGRLK